MAWISASALISEISDWLTANKEWVFSGIGVAIIGTLWAFGQWLARRWPSRAAPSFLSPDRAARNRARMLAKVRHMWVEGVLEQSLYQVARMELGLSESPTAIEHPWTLVTQQPERAPRTLPPGIPMLEVFDQLDQTFLLLGEPGSGKTTLLLALARDLIARATGDPSQSIPVLFNLSTWAVKRPPLTKWLVDELIQRYDVPGKVAQAWVEHDVVLPLLDGLDEVAIEHRDSCVQAINEFRREHGLLPLVH